MDLEEVEGGESDQNTEYEILNDWMSQRGLRTPETWPTKSTKHGSYGFTKTEMTSIEPSWVSTRSTAYI